jgi:glycerate kinase
MRYLLAPNSFRDALSSPRAAAAMAAGVRRAEPSAEIVEMPLADGGDGTLEVLSGLLAARRIEVVARDPLGRPLAASIALGDGGRTAIVEMAEASGLKRLAPADRDPLRADTRGTGDLLRAALDLGARDILLGAGGSGTIDAGAGALAALGAVFRDAAGRALEPSPAALSGLAAVDLSGLDPRLREARIVVLADISTPLERHVALYGGQKGAPEGDRPALEDHLRRIDALAAERGHPLAGRPWLGAAGCLAGGLAAFAGARVVPGAEEIARRAGLRERLEGVDLVMSGEGRVDATSFEDKLPATVARLSAAAGVPMVMVAGQLAADAAPPGVVATFGLSRGPESLESALAATAERLTRTCEQVARLFGAARAVSAAVAPAEEVPA